MKAICNFFSSLANPNMCAPAEVQPPAAPHAQPSRSASRRPTAESASWEQLRDAVSSGDPGTLFDLLSSSGPVRHEVLRELVSQAISENQVDAVRVLLFDNHAQQYSEIPNGGDTALMEAVRFGSKDMVSALVNAGACIDAQNSGGETALMTCATLKSGADKLLALIEAGADLNAKDKLGKTALMYSSREVGGRTDSAERAVLRPSVGTGHHTETLIKAGADINARDQDGTTALMWAAIRSDMSAAIQLFDAGADCAVQDMSGSTALMYATGGGCIPLLSKLARTGGDVDVKDDDGYTALLHAVSKRSLEAVLVLIAAKSDVNAADASGSTALMLAADQGDDSMCRALMAAGANMNAKDTKGDTALQRALLGVRGNPSQTVKYLVEAGADVNLADDNGVTPCMNWAKKGDGPIGKMLIDAGANIDAKNKDEKTALMFSVKSGYCLSIKHLRKAGADINIKNNLGQTAFEYVVQLEGDTPKGDSMKPVRRAVVEELRQAALAGHDS